MLSNPHKRKRSSRRRSKRHANPVNSHRSHRRRKNPLFASSRRHRHTRRRRNPAGSIGGYSIKEVAILGAGAAAGGLASRIGTQTILGAKNTGWQGYLAQLALSLGLGWGAGKVFKSKALGYAVAGGGFAFLLARIWEEKVTMTSISLHGLGDIAYSSQAIPGMSAYADGGMGEIIQGNFAIPSNSALVGSNYQIKNAPALAAAAAIAGKSPVSVKAFKSPFQA